MRLWARSGARRAPRRWHPGPRAPDPRSDFGTIQHELLIFKSDLPPSAYPVDSNGHIIENGPGINLVNDGDNIDPGKTQTRTGDLTQPGTYLFVCNIPGHFKAGMFTVVTVTP